MSIVPDKKVEQLQFCEAHWSVWSTSALDRGPKLRKHARERVARVWFVDPDAKTLEILRLDGETYRIIASHAAEDVVRAEPFEELELELALLWTR